MSEELGIRIALGATRPRLAALVVGESLRLVAIGGVLGLGLAAALARLLAGQLYGISPADPWTYGVALAVLFAIAAAAALPPARRAAGVDPVRAMRSE